ncbi:MAG: MBOAT family protein [Clostridia bacterium]|nr:MBOAT family protein [Clostridia bacterium]
MSLFQLAAYGAVCCAVYYLVPRRIRWMFLLAASLGFYAFRAAACLPFILLTALSVWGAALTMGRISEACEAQIREKKDSLAPADRKNLRREAKGRKRAVMLAALVLNFAILAVLKYTDDVRGWLGLSRLGLLLPLGISFYTFQSTGYLLDVYNGKTAPQRNPAKFCLFVAFFPQLLQGPIARYDDLSAQLTEPHDFDAQTVKRGAVLLFWGLLKKLVIADRALPLVDAVFSAEAGSMGGAAAVVGVLAYSLQQYCDFSGGIDLITGIAEFFGIRLAPNFKRPYFSVSLADFWRRWHISLGAWMRDYVFYPFALTRPVTRLSKAAKKRFGAEFARALPAALGNILVFLLVGVWHGATSNYILWGLYNGVLLALSALLEPAFRRLNERHAALTSGRGFHVFRVLRTFVIVNIGWFFDRCAHAGDALSMMGRVVTDLRAEQITAEWLGQCGLPAPDAAVLAAYTLLLFGVSLAAERGVQVRDGLLRLPLPLRWALLYALIFSVLIFGVWGSGFNEASFIYFQF